MQEIEEHEGELGEWDEHGFYHLPDKSFYDSNGAVGGGGGASKVYSSTIFAYQNIVQSDITIESPYLTGTIYSSEDVTVDIEDGVTVTVNDGAVLNIIDI